MRYAQAARLSNTGPGVTPQCAAIMPYGLVFCAECFTQQNCLTSTAATSCAPPPIADMADWKPSITHKQVSTSNMLYDSHQLCLPWLPWWHACTMIANAVIRKTPFLQCPSARA